jgi:hypothetical protein
VLKPLYHKHSLSHHPPAETAIRAAMLRALGHIWRTDIRINHPLTRRFFEGSSQSSKRASRKG